MAYREVKGSPCRNKASPFLTERRVETSSSSLVASSSLRPTGRHNSRRLHCEQAARASATIRFTALAGRTAPAVLQMLIFDSRDLIYVASGPYGKRLATLDLRQDACPYSAAK